MYLPVKFDLKMLVQSVRVGWVKITAGQGLTVFNSRELGTSRVGKVSIVYLLIILLTGTCVYTYHYT